MPGKFVSTPGRDKFQALLNEYVATNRRDNVELVTKKAKSATQEFYRATIAAAPTLAEIKAKVLSLGWQVKRKKGGWPYKKGEKRGSKGPLNRMRASVIGRRQKTIGVASTGWLPALKQLGGKASGSTKVAQVARPKGTITVERTSPTRFTIVVENNTPGITHLEEKYRITEQGFEKAGADIEKYLNAKKAGRSGTSAGGN